MTTALQVGDRVSYLLPDGISIGDLYEVPCVVSEDEQGRAVLTYTPEGGEPVVFTDIDPARCHPIAPAIVGDTTTGGDS